MRLSELGEKEIVNLDNGARMGLLIDADIVFDKETGKIHSLIAPERKIGFKFLGIEQNGIEIPWSAIRKIGYDMIIVEFDS
ncbi:YlmC/YmxH family sporulation protein [Wansuia hejianensis]|uniref:YlmC/YmxH family sporulation protein n=1 Tax=Wansuia hejianensis TaxID=2763667 RepID=A0A926ILU5_9FIRM|nr:YlmC/YmxH family sporulation protein [Wansuia hejianensis]MBC8590519.1 YlmC/YmxH family sporulation protein [Wansuia hejianensis]